MPNAVAEGPMMTNLRLAEAFLTRAGQRLASLEALRHEADFNDVVREARDIVELCFRGMLRIAGVEVPRWRDVGEVLAENVHKLPGDVAAQRDRILEIYRDLKKDRQPLLPDEVPPPAEKLLLADADRAYAGATWIVEMARVTIEIVSRRRTSPIHA